MPRTPDRILSLARVHGCAALILLAGCSRPPGRVTLSPPALPDGLPVSTPAREGMNSDLLRRAFVTVESSGRFRAVHSLLVVRHGRLVAEGYFGATNRDSRNDVRSVAKSVTSLVVGTALAAGEVPTLQQSVGEVFPDYTSTGSPKRAITLAHLLSMRSGLRWSERAHGDLDPGMMAAARNSVQDVLRFPLAAKPGTTFNYSTGNSQIVSGMLTRATGRTVAQIAEARIFGPMGIRDFEWETHRDGLSYGGMRLFLTARDMAKIGILCLNEGRWGAKQLVPAEWIRASTRPKSTTGYGAYGYGWWIRGGGYTAQGWGGQYIYVLPEDDLVVVMTADPNRGTHIDFEVAEQLIDHDIRGAITAGEGSGAPS